MFQVLIKRTEVNTCSWRARETFCIPSARALALATIAFASPEHEYNNINFNNKDNNEEEKQRVQVWVRMLSTDEIYPSTK